MSLTISSAVVGDAGSGLPRAIIVLLEKRFPGIAQGCDGCRTLRSFRQRLAKRSSGG
jgi:hypothetical protein